MISTEIRLIRTPSGPKVEGVDQVVIWHSPTGFEWGYGGSGPADLALNILQEALRRKGYVGEIEHLGRSWAYGRAVSLHQAFKWEVVCRIPHEGGTIYWEDIDKWLENHP